MPVLLQTKERGPYCCCTYGIVAVQRQHIIRNLKIVAACAQCDEAIKEQLIIQLMHVAPAKCKPQTVLFALDKLTPDTAYF